MICEILSVGTEILLGDITDTNSSYISKEMAKMGISVLHHSTTGDNYERLSQMVRTAIDRSDIVIATGGLGPTDDDITRQVCCKEFGFNLIFSEEIATKIKSYFTRKGSDMPETNLRQAYYPDGGVIFDNKNGTAPGLGMKRNGKCMILLPGPPYEMAPIFKESVIPYLEEYRKYTIVSHEVRTMCIGESAMAEKVIDLMNNENPTVAPYCKPGEAFLRVSSKASSKEEAEKLSAPVINEICKRLGDYVYGIDCVIEEKVVSLLKEKKLTIATAESCTAGYVAKRITDVPGASSVFKEGSVTYSNEVKQRVLGVKKSTLDSYGAVSKETAEEMAQGIRKVSGADIGVSVTGLAGPDGDEGKPVGTIWVALSKENLTVSELVETGRTDREYNRYVSASRVLNLVRKVIEGGN